MKFEDFLSVRSIICQKRWEIFLPKTAQKYPTLIWNIFVMPFKIEVLMNWYFTIGLQ